MNLLHMVMWRKNRSLWRPGPELPSQGYGSFALLLTRPACGKATGASLL